MPATLEINGEMVSPEEFNKCDYDMGFDEGFQAGYATAVEDFDIDLLEDVIGKQCTIICNCGGNGMHQLGELTKVTPNAVVLRTSSTTSTIIYREDITVVEWVE